MIKFRNALHNEKGFTLIELLVVVIIIGILAAVALPNLIGASDNAKKERAQADLKVIETALSAYYAEEGKYPATADKDLLVTNKLLKSWPKDPWDVDYTYTNTNGTIEVVPSESSYKLTNGGIQSYTKTVPSN